MRHRKRGRKLGRNPAHRRAMLRNMANSLFLHGRIVTTVAKAKELRPFAERLITIARRGTVHARRLVVARLGKQPIPEGHPDHGRYHDITHKLFAEVAPRYVDRPGGYTRIIRLNKRRLGDAGELAVIELVTESIAESRERNARRRRLRTTAGESESTAAPAAPTAEPDTAAAQATEEQGGEAEHGVPQEASQQEAADAKPLQPESGQQAAGQTGDEKPAE